MNQTRKKSLEEAIVNVIVGFLVGIGLNMFVLPILLGIPFESIPLDLAIYISLLYGGLSIIRSFILRRYYNSNKRWRLW